MANLTKCMICGEKYAYCPNCANTHAWRFYADTYEHYQIFMALDQYKVMGKEATKATLEHIGVTADSDTSKFKPSIAQQIKDIFADDIEKVEPEEKTVLKKTRKSKLYKDE